MSNTECRQDLYISSSQCDLSSLNYNVTGITGDDKNGNKKAYKYSYILDEKQTVSTLLKSIPVWTETFSYSLRGNNVYTLTVLRFG